MKRGVLALLRFSDRLPISTRLGPSSRRLLVKFFFFNFYIYLIITEWLLHNNIWSVGEAAVQIFLSSRCGRHTGGVSSVRAAQSFFYEKVC